MNILIAGLKRLLATHSLSDGGFTTALELEVKIDDLDME